VLAVPPTLLFTADEVIEQAIPISSMQRDVPSTPFNVCYWRSMDLLRIGRDFRFKPTTDIGPF
jgi:hypothetical protein